MAGPDIKKIDALPVPGSGDETPAPEPDTKNLDALLASLNSSAERFQTLWFSFLGLTLYFAIAALTTTHRDLLLGEPKTLPLLNIQVPLLPFYVIAPLLYLVFHFYLLMMLALLARTAAEFDKQLRTTLPDEPERERYRARVENALFLQLLVGMKGERTGVNALLMGLIALITIVLAPLATLVLMQMMFLPYHHLRITWWHRVVVVADLVLIVVMTYRCFFPRGIRKAPLVLGALSRKPRWATAMTFCVLLAVTLVPLVDWLSFQQGRWAGEPTTSSGREWARWMEGRPPPSPEVNPDYAATEDGVVFGLFPDRLQLNDETIVGEKLLEETKREIASRGGDLVPTRNLDGRNLQAADLRHADLRGVALRGAAMQGANLGAARLDGADLESVEVGGNSFPTLLQGANLSFAQLEGADFIRAQLQGANLEYADLQGANLYEALLQGADLSGSHLQGALLVGARLQGANLSEAQLRGADLLGAQLQGALLAGAHLQGANLSEAQFQGANLTSADLSDSEFDKTFVFRADIGNANVSTSAIRSVHADQVKLGEDSSKVDELREADVTAWIDAAVQFAAENDKEAIRKRFERLKLNSGFQTRDQDAAEEAKWAELTKQSLALDPDDAQHRQRLAAFLGGLACDPDGAPYVARGLVERPNSGLLSRLAGLGDQFAAVRARMEEGRKTPDTCKGVAGLTQGDWRGLEALKPD